MIYQSRKRVVTAIGVILAIALVLSGIWLLVSDRGDGGTAQPPGAPPATTGAAPTEEPSGSSTVTPATITVTVFFHRGQNIDPARVVAVRRIVPRTSRVATASLQQLLSGPTAQEREAGYWSHFSKATTGMLRSVQVSGGVARADFRDFREIIPNASSSAGSTALLAELDGTLKQFSTVRTTVYSFNDDIEVFYEWLQREPPKGTTPTLAEASRVAREFLTGVVGMKDPVYAASRWRSDYIATADFRPRVGPVTTVVLGKGKTSFTVLGTSTDTIRVATPKSAITPSDLQVIKSPVTVAGEALAFEGAVSIRVMQVAGAAVRQLGTGFVTGGGDVMRPFTGAVSFDRPSVDTGWVIAFERSARDGSVTKATVVRVAFTTMP